METRDDIRRFATAYFEAVGASIVRCSPDLLEVTVPVEIDKELTDRPYYWMWVEATGQSVEPPTWTFVFDPEQAEDAGGDSAEWLAPGSFRLQKMYDSACRRGRFVRQFEVSPAAAPLLPVLLVYHKISYISDRRKDRILALALDLLDGRVAIDHGERCIELPLADSPGERQVYPPNLDWDSAWSLLCAALRVQLSHEDHDWAAEARQRREEEEIRLMRYYEQLLREREDDRHILEAEWSVRREELKWRLGPRILVTPLQWAWLSLTPSTVADIFSADSVTTGRIPG
ncbi:MAG: hypothetical protein IRY98_03945 [Alicyclobacillaceae bacterium]|nr:hypothetical protein [Alicyclobacillaceae bacterium]